MRARKKITTQLTKSHSDKLAPTGPTQMVVLAAVIVQVVVPIVTFSYAILRLNIER